MVRCCFDRGPSLGVPTQRNSTPASYARTPTAGVPVTNPCVRGMRAHIRSAAPRPNPNVRFRPARPSAGAVIERLRWSRTRWFQRGLANGRFRRRTAGQRARRDTAGIRFTGSIDKSAALQALSDRVVDVTPPLDGFDVAVHRGEVRADRYDGDVAPSSFAPPRNITRPLVVPATVLLDELEAECIVSLPSSASLASILALIWTASV